MINGAHAILYSEDADATRAALGKVLGTRSVDAGGGWLIFALPPAELAVHPAEEGGRPVSDQGWGLLTAIALPGGVELGLYQPRHPTATQPS
jgi:hypothetical protein